MNLVPAILALYPDAKPNIDFRVADFSDEEGRGQEIVMWNLPDPQPTLEDLQKAWDGGLSEAASSKKAEISSAVAAKITSGYNPGVVLASTGKAHVYGTELPDQQNMSADYAYLANHPEEASIDFRTQDSVTWVVHTREEFIKVAEAVRSYIRSSLGKGYALGEQLAAAKTPGDVQGIVVNLDDQPVKASAKAPRKKK